MIEKPVGLLVALAAVIVLVTAACGGDEATSTPQPVANATPTSTPNAMAKFQMEWNVLLEAAQAEGEVVTFICCGVGRVILDKTPEFEAKYGIKWINSTGSSRQQADKVQAERAASKYTLDVWMGGFGTANTRLLPNNVLSPVEPLLFHPEVLDKSKWYEGDWVWTDPEEQRYLFAFAANGQPAEYSYNTELVDPSQIQSYWDLLKPEWKGKIVIRDPRLAGTSGPLVYYYLHPDIGPEWIRRLMTEMDVVVTDDARQAAELLALGTYSICLFACRSEVAAAKADGLPVEPSPPPPQEGSQLEIGGNAVFAVDNPPHPNAQKFFINWWLSREGQIAMQDAAGYDSLRVDIPKGSVNVGDRRQEGLDYFFRDRDPRAVPAIAEAQALAAEALASVGK